MRAMIKAMMAMARVFIRQACPHRLRGGGMEVASARWARSAGMLVSFR